MDKKKKYIQMIMLIIFIAVMVIATYLMIPLIKLLNTEEGRLLIAEKVKAHGTLSVLMFLLLQIIQVVVAIIPGEPVEVMGGILFGGFGGFGLCMAGVLVGTVTVYYLVSWVGKPLVNAVVDSDKLNKYKILNDNRRLELFIFVLFLIPGTPKDALTYLVPMTKIKPHKFFIYSTIARIPSVISSTFVGSNIGKGRWVLSIVIFSLTVVIGLVGIYYNEKIISKAKKANKKNRGEVKKN